MDSQTVIVLAFANDRKGKFLRSIAEEHRGIKSSLQQLQEKGLIKLVELPDARIEDIFDAFRRNKDMVRIFHYGGHAEDLDLLLSSSGETLDIQAFAQYLSQQKGLELSFMNGCTTLLQREALEAAGIPSMILTHREIGDKAAKEFSRKFYDNLASGREIRRSFEEAQAELQTQKEGLFRSLNFGEEEFIGDSAIPWELFQSRENTWTLPTKVPFPLPKLSLALSICMLFAIGIWSYRTYFQEFDMRISLELPEGVGNSHFPKDFLHSLRLDLGSEIISAQINPEGFVEFRSLNGSLGAVPISMHSPFWTLNQHEIVIQRNPDRLGLFWKDPFKQIRGKATDMEGAPLKGVEISLNQSKTKTISNKNGDYVLRLPKELYSELTLNLELKKEGYIDALFPINRADTLADYSVYMKKEKND
ncbi:MAG: CHAT domain-containing protein [Bacteroidota bacterium]